MANDFGIVQANPSLKLFDLLRGKTPQDHFIPQQTNRVPGSFDTGIAAQPENFGVGGTGRFFGQSADPVSVPLNPQSARSLLSLMPGAAGAPATTPPTTATVAPATTTPSTTTPQASAASVPVAKPVSAPIATPAPSSETPSPGNTIQASVLRPVGTINGRPVNVKPVSTSGVDVPSLGVKSLLSPQVQKDVLGVDQSASGTNIVAREAPGEKRWAFAPGGGVIGGTPSAVVAYPKGTGPTRPAPLTEDQMLANEERASRVAATWGNDAVIRATPEENATLLRMRAGSERGPSGAEVRRRIVIGEGETAANQATGRQRSLLYQSGQNALNIEREKGKTARDVAAANQAAQIAARDRIFGQQVALEGVRQQGRSELAGTRQEMKVDADRVKMGLKQVAAGNDDAALELLIPQYTAMHATGKIDPTVESFVLEQLNKKALSLIPKGSDAQRQNLVRELAKVNGNAEALSPEVKAKFGLK